VATVNKDFRVKHGINVAEGGTFGGTVTVATPTENTHAATKAYVDSATNNVIVASDSEFPESPTEGQLFFDTVTDHIYIFYSSAWYSIAMYSDTVELAQHIHDTAIDGTGLIVSTFKDAGFYDSSADSTDAGFYNTVAWQVTWDGGIAVDNFN
jgi:hypothetical protein